jgi:hypothetical protein
MSQREAKEHPLSFLVVSRLSSTGQHSSASAKLIDEVMTLQSEFMRKQFGCKSASNFGPLTKLL